MQKLIQALLNEFSSLLDAESITFVQHYLDHGEYEMAFEGLFIELMKANAQIDKCELEKYFKLGQDLHLDEDSVFDGSFWDKFKEFAR